MPVGLLEMLAKTIAVAFGQRLAERVATELVCTIAKGCPEKVDKIASDVKAKQAARAGK